MLSFEHRDVLTNGHVEPVGSETEAAATDEDETGQVANETAQSAEPNSTEAKEARGEDDQQAVSSIDDLPLPFDLAADSAGEGEAATESKPTVRDEPVTAHKADGQVAGMAASEDAGKRFVAWLKHSIENQTVPINTAQARIHVLPEGLALVSPRIFRDFDSANWSHAQKRFQKLKLHRKTLRDENIWTCQATGSRKQSLLKVILIPDAAGSLGVNLPKPNAAITLLHTE